MEVTTKARKQMLQLGLLRVGLRWNAGPEQPCAHESTTGPERPPSLLPEPGAKLLRMQYEKGKKLLENPPISSASEHGKTATRRRASSAWFHLLCNLFHSICGCYL